MHLETNQPDEIRRRLAFVFYLCCWIATILLGVIGLATGKFQALLGSVLLGAFSFIFKQYGERSLEFERLARSFPFGAPEDELPENLRKKVESIFHEFAVTEKDWQRRLELRRELAVLIEKNPELIHTFPREISAIQPKFASQSDHS